jgi:hypothetical protein
MNAKIRLTRHDHGLTIADDRTGLRLEVVETPDGLYLEAYGYFADKPAPELEVPKIQRVRHPDLTIRMPDPTPVPVR